MLRDKLSLSIANLVVECTSFEVSYSALNAETETKKLYLKNVDLVDLL